MQLNFAAAAQVRYAIHSACHEVLLAVPGELRSPHEHVDVAAVQDVAEDGVCVRLFVPEADEGASGQPGHQLATLARHGVEIRTTSGRAPRMVIIDRSVVVLARNQSDYSEGALIGRRLPFTAMLVCALTQARRDQERAYTGEAELDPQARQVLRQLSLGTKDEAAARELGMALRTYRRMVARLMDVLDADSRFQAGVLAAQRHWL